MPQSKGLGRSLGSLIPQDVNTAVMLDKGERIQQIAIDVLSPNPDQPRTLFDEAALQELAASISQHGIVQPLVVSPKGKSYLIIAGERRWRAAQLAGLKTVPAIVRSFKQQEQLEVALIENVQRVDLGPLEQAVSIERLHQQFNLSYSDIAKRLAKSESTLSNTVRLLQLPTAAQQALSSHDISEGHARQLLALKAMPTAQDELLSAILTNGWSVRQAERYVTSLKNGAHTSQAAKIRLEPETNDTKQLSKRFGTPVKIYRTAKGGRLEIRFTSDDELARLLNELKN
ncbi:ParB/RepB/Spo0J family partition protein [Candidatus Saccharibacteria bacterium]|nr:ParB/RepB/Spo0J family partition protein [Candidatus Saccharibacteria bacterium]